MIFAVFILIGIASFTGGYLLAYLLFEYIHAMIQCIWRAVAPRSWLQRQQQQHQLHYQQWQLQNRVIHFPYNNITDVSNSRRGRTRNAAHVKPTISNQLLEQGLIRIGFPQYAHVETKSGSDEKEEAEEEKEREEEEEEEEKHKDEYGNEHGDEYCRYTFTFIGAEQV